MLILLSNGETEAQKNNIVSGQLNDALTEEGKLQALEAGENLADYELHAVFCSDLERCQDTTKTVLDKNRFSHGVQPVLVEELRDRSFGILEGRPMTEIRKELAPKKYKLWDRDYFEAPPMGESLQDVEQRVIPYLREYVFPLVRENKNVLIVTHNDIIKVIIGHLKHSDESDTIRWKIETAVPYFFYGTDID